MRVIILRGWDWDMLLFARVVDGGVEVCFGDRFG